MGVARQEYLINEGRQKFQLVTTLVGAAVNVGLNLWAIPRWGGLGAAAVALVSHLVADLLTSLVWPPAQAVGRWQLRALTGCWRLPQTPASPG
jgi:O-antigen/teichoic acid export membrane protein